MATADIVISDYDANGDATREILIRIMSDDGQSWGWRCVVGYGIGNGDLGGWVEPIYNNPMDYSIRIRQDNGAGGGGFLALDLSADSFPPRAGSNGFGTHNATSSANLPGGSIKWRCIALRN
jgi:hypothetical protein